MQLAPSNIHFLKDYPALCFKADQNLLNVLSTRLLKLTELPKIQVVERNGAWFALNNAYLHVFRELERQGKCPRIHVDVVPLSKVPKIVQEGMVVDAHPKPEVWEQQPQMNNNATKETVFSSSSSPALASSTYHTPPTLINNPMPSNGATSTQKSEGQDNAYQMKEDDLPNGNCVAMRKKIVDRPSNGCFAQNGPGRATKRGYQKLSEGEIDNCSMPLHDSETEGTNSFSSTDYSDYDGDGDDGEADSDSDYDESLTCNVCDRSFPSTRKLAQHQQRKRHFGCSICDSIFPTLMTLELHKESLEHWSDEEGNAQGGSDEDSDDDNDNIHSPKEELERLL